MQEKHKNNQNSANAGEQQTTNTTEVQEVVKTIGFPDGNDPDTFLFGVMDLF